MSFKNIDQIKAIIFDFDGVIVNSEPVHEKAEIQTCQEFGLDVPRGEWENFRGKRIDDIFSFVSRKYGDGSAPIEKMIERKIELYLLHALESLELIPGAYEFLEEMAGSGKYRLALTTSGRKYQQEKILSKFDLAKFFEIIVTADNVKNGKPDPEPYLVTAKMLAEEPRNCLVIEDSDNGIISAKAAGCFACGITNTFSEEKLRLAGADEIVNNFSDFKTFL